MKRTAFLLSAWWNPTATNLAGTAGKWMRSCVPAIRANVAVAMGTGVRVGSGVAVPGTVTVVSGVLVVTAETTFPFGAACPDAGENEIAAAPMARIAKRAASTLRERRACTSPFDRREAPGVALPTVIPLTTPCRDRVRAQATA